MILIIKKVIVFLLGVISLLALVIGLKLPVFVGIPLGFALGIICAQINETLK